jgi:aquaporin Z
MNEGRTPPLPGAKTAGPGANSGQSILDGLKELEFVRKTEFDDPGNEWRRLVSELLGTFFLVVVAAGGGVVNAVSNGAIPLAARVTAPGLMVLGIILFMGAIGGAHLNPAVTLSFAIRGDFPWRRVPGYIVVQLLGAGLACLFLLLMFGDVGGLGATVPGPGISNVQAVVMEALLTFGLVSVILGTASSAQNVGSLSAIAVGAYIVLAGLWAAPISGASMNPARSFGPALVSGNWSSYWVYVVGPLVGGAIACGFAWALRSGADLGAELAAQGRLGRVSTPNDDGKAGDGRKR